MLVIWFNLLKRLCAIIDTFSQCYGTMYIHVHVIEMFMNKLNLLKNNYFYHMQMVYTFSKMEP